MVKITIPYKAHNNKVIWDYLTQICAQINNINLAKSLNDVEADVDNVVYLVFTRKHIYVFVALSQQIDEDNYSSYCDVWARLNDVSFNSFNVDEQDCKIYSFDIKKYNSVVSFTEDYSARDKISFLIDEQTDKLFYSVIGTDYVDLSPIVITSEIREAILESFDKYIATKKLKKDVSNYQYLNALTVSSVDKNSFLLPFMAYRDFLNFATYSCNSRSYIVANDETNTVDFINCLVSDGDLKFYLSSVLRQDKFNFERTNITVPSSLWQILVILQHYKTWQTLKYYVDNTADLIFNVNEPETSTVTHIMKYNNVDNTFYSLDLSDFRLVGKMHSNELFKINKLYSNANRTCYFDFSTQTFTGNNYVFSDQKLDIKTVELSTKVEAELPLKITMTEIKHYIGSDLSQKNFMLKVYTDGIRVMLERWVNDETLMECRVIFNHAMSKKNQSLNMAL